LVICIYKTSLLHRPNDYIGFTPSCTPLFTTKLRLLTKGSIVILLLRSKHNYRDVTVLIRV